MIAQSLLVSNLCSSPTRNTLTCDRAVSDKSPRTALLVSLLNHAKPQTSGIPGVTPEVTTRVQYEGEPWRLTHVSTPHTPLFKGRSAEYVVPAPTCHRPCFVCSAQLPQANLIVTREAADIYDSVSRSAIRESRIHSLTKYIES